MPAVDTGYPTTRRATMNINYGPLRERHPRSTKGILLIMLYRGLLSGALLQFGLFLLGFSLSLQSIAFSFRQSFLFAAFVFRILAHSKHGTVSASPRRTIVAAGSHIARNLLRSRKPVSAAHAVRHSPVFALTDQPRFEIDILVAAFLLQSDQFVVRDVMNAIDGACFNGHLDRFVIVAPLLKDARAAVFRMHEKGGLGYHGAVGTSDALTVLNKDMKKW